MGSNDNLPRRITRRSTAGFTALVFFATQLACPLPAAALRTQGADSPSVLAGLEEALNQRGGEPIESGTVPLPLEAVFAKRRNGNGIPLRPPALPLDRQISLQEALWAANQKYELHGKDTTEFPKTWKAVRSLWDQILKVAGFDPEAYDLYLAETQEENAQVLSHGNVAVVTLGLIRTLIQAGASLDALAFILAHETVHLRRRLEDLSLEKGRALPTDWMAQLESHAFRYVEEYDADIEALQLLQRAGFSVQDASAGFRAIQKRIGKEGFDLYRDHPDLAQRIRTIEDLVLNEYWPGYFVEPKPFPTAVKQEALQRSRLRRFQEKVLAIEKPEDFLAVVEEAETQADMEFAALAGVSQLHGRLASQKKTLPEPEIDGLVQKLNQRYSRLSPDPTVGDRMMWEGCAECARAYLRGAWNAPHAGTSRIADFLDRVTHDDLKRLLRGEWLRALEIGGPLDEKGERDKIRAYTDYRMGHSLIRDGALGEILFRLARQDWTGVPPEQRADLYSQYLHLESKILFVPGVVMASASSTPITREDLLNKLAFFELSLLRVPLLEGPELESLSRRRYIQALERLTGELESQVFLSQPIGQIFPLTSLLRGSEIDEKKVEEPRRYEFDEEMREPEQMEERKKERKEIPSDFEKLTELEREEALWESTGAPGTAEEEPEVIEIEKPERESVPSIDVEEAVVYPAKNRLIKWISGGEAWSQAFLLLLGQGQVPLLWQLFLEDEKAGSSFQAFSKGKHLGRLVENMPQRQRYPILLSLARPMLGVQSIEQIHLLKGWYAESPTALLNRYFEGTDFLRHEGNVTTLDEFFWIVVRNERSPTFREEFNSTMAQIAQTMGADAPKLVSLSDQIQRLIYFFQAGGILSPLVFRDILRELSREPPEALEAFYRFMAWLGPRQIERGIPKEPTASRNPYRVQTWNDYITPLGVMTFLKKYRQPADQAFGEHPRMSRLNVVYAMFPGELVLKKEDDSYEKLVERIGKPPFDRQRLTRLVRPEEFLQAFDWLLDQKVPLDQLRQDVVALVPPTALRNIMLYLLFVIRILPQEFRIQLSPNALFDWDSIRNQVAQLDSGRRAALAQHLQTYILPQGQPAFVEDKRLELAHLAGLSHSGLVRIPFSQLFEWEKPREEEQKQEIEEVVSALMEEGEEEEEAVEKAVEEIADSPRPAEEGERLQKMREEDWKAYQEQKGRYPDVAAYDLGGLPAHPDLLLGEMARDYLLNLIEGETPFTERFQTILSLFPRPSNKRDEYLTRLLEADPRSLEELQKIYPVLYNQAARQRVAIQALELERARRLDELKQQGALDPEGVITLDEELERIILLPIKTRGG